MHCNERIRRTLGHLYPHKEVEHSETGNDGRVDYGKIKNFFYLKVKRPKTVDPDLYYADSKVFMDQVVKGIGFNRKIESESIRVTSIGPADEEHIFEDTYARKWQVRTWKVAFSDDYFVVYSLPTPDGYIALLSYTDSTVASMFELDMRLMVNIFYFTYYGTLDDWDQFLKRKQLLPGFASSIAIDTDRKSFLSYRDRYFNIKITDHDFKLTGDSDLQLRCGYFNEDGKVVWAPAAISIGESKNSLDLITIGRNIKPPTELAEQYRKRWDLMVTRRSPFDMQAYNEVKMTSFTMILENTHSLQLAEQSVIYNVSWNNEGKANQEEMENRISHLAPRIQIPAIPAKTQTQTEEIIRIQKE